MQKTKKIQLHYSIAKMWTSGHQDDAIRSLMGLETTFKNDAMVNGSRLHKIIETNEMRLFKGLSTNLSYEYYKEVELNDFITYAGTIDMVDWDSHKIYDWKSGTMSVLDHPKMQLYCYSLLIDTDIHNWTGIMAKIAEDSNGYISVGETAIYKLNEQKKEVARNYLETIGMEILQAINSN